MRLALQAGRRVSWNQLLLLRKLPQPSEEAALGRAGGGSGKVCGRECSSPSSSPPTLHPPPPPPLAEPNPELLAKQICVWRGPGLNTTEKYKTGKRAHQAQKATYM